MGKGADAEGWLTREVGAVVVAAGSCVKGGDRQANGGIPRRRDRDFGSGGWGRPRKHGNEDHPDEDNKADPSNARAPQELRWPIHISPKNRRKSTPRR